MTQFRFVATEDIEAGEPVVIDADTGKVRRALPTDADRAMPYPLPALHLSPVVKVAVEPEDLSAILQPPSTINPNVFEAAGRSFLHLARMGVEPSLIAWMDDDIAGLTEVNIDGRINVDAGLRGFLAILGVTVERAPASIAEIADGLSADSRQYLLYYQTGKLSPQRLTPELVEKMLVHLRVDEEGCVEQDTTPLGFAVATFMWDRGDRPRE